MPPRKLWDIDHPPVVVLAGAADHTGPLAEALAEGTDYRVETVDAPADALERLEERPAVDCLWLAPEDDAASTLSLIESASERDPSTQLVFAPAAGGEALAADATAAGADEYVAEDATVDDRVARAAAAVDRAIDRRHDAVKRSVLENLLDDLDANLFAKDDQARHVVHVSDTTTVEGEELFGLTDTEAFLTADETLEEAYQDDLAVIEEGEPIIGKVERYPEFQEGWQYTSRVPWTEDGEVRGLVGLTLDVSEWKNRERELLQRVAHLQRIPKYLTHDLRNPMAIAQGYVGEAKDGDEEAIEVIEESLERLDRRLSEFHKFVDVGVESGAARGPVQFTKLVEDLWAHVSLPGTELELLAPADAHVLADEEQLRPLLENLFRNAIDHAGPRVTVRVELHDDGFSVSDDGPGLPASGEQLLGQEEAAHKETASDGGANGGLGLAIVREVAQLHNWEVETDEGDLGGAEFRFRGPIFASRLDADPVDADAADDSALVLDRTGDVGDVETPGNATVEGDSVRLAGAGDNVWGWVNEFQFASAEVEGPVRLTARLDAMDVVNQYSKAGVMVRGGRDPDAAYAAVCRLKDQYPELLWRSERGERGFSYQLDGVPAATRWLRVEREGDRVVCSISADGEEWTPVDDRRIELDEPVEIGLFACSTVPGERLEARFEDVELRRLRE